MSERKSKLIDRIHANKTSNQQKSPEPTSRREMFEVHHEATVTKTMIDDYFSKAMDEIQEKKSDKQRHNTLKANPFNEYLNFIDAWQDAKESRTDDRNDKFNMRNDTLLEAWQNETMEAWKNTGHQ